MRFKTLSPAWLFLFLGLFAAQALVPIFQNSPTADEPEDLTDGYFYWQGDLLSNAAHPPLAKALQALPLLALHPNGHPDAWVSDCMDRAWDFCFVLNRDRFQALFWAGRLVSLLFGLGTGLLLWGAARDWGPGARLCVMCLFAFEPTLLAFSGLAVSDGPVTFFTLAAALAFRRHLAAPGWKWAAGAGILTAAAVTCKFSALALLPAFAVLEFLKRGKRKTRRPAWALDWAWGALAFASFTVLLYLPGTLWFPGHPAPWWFLAQGLSVMASQTHAFHVTYFLGEAGHHNHWLYYPAAFLLKSALPFLILALLGITLKRTREPWLLVFPGVIFLSILPVQDLGVRYLLPAYPFLILLGGRAAAGLWDWKPRTSRRAGKLLAVGLLAWQAATALLNNGNLIGYFNDLVPPGKKLYLLGDSNLDWGQETGKMARFARKEGWTRVKLAQFGGLDPGFYGLKAEGWTKRDLQGPQPGWVYLANAALLQEGPVFEPDLTPLVESWMLTVPPTGRVGDTWYYWDIPGTPAADPTAPVDSRRPMGARERGLIPASRSAGP